MGEKVSTGLSPADALKMMLLPTQGRSTKSMEYWANRWGVAASTLYMMCEGERDIPLRIAILATNDTGDPLLLNTICATTGYVALSIKQYDLPNDAPVLEKLMEAAQQSAEFIKTTCEAARDRVITDDEKTVIDREFIEMVVTATKAREAAYQLPAKPENLRTLKREVM